MGRMSLIDTLAQEMGCTYVSDVARLQKQEKRKLASILRRHRPEEAPLFEWNDALRYIGRGGPQDTPEAAWRNLIEVLDREFTPHPG